MIPHAAIKGQCARHKFYGSAEIENLFSRLEGLHASCLQALVRAGNSGDINEFSFDHFPWLMQAIVFQRARTMLEVEKTFPAVEAMILKMFKEHLLHTLPPERIDEYVGAIDRGEVRITEEPTSTVFRQITVALESATLLVDLQPRLVRNYSDYPFVFSDSPVVFYNQYYQHITDRGVLGLQTPGLMIFYPLTPQLQLMMIDPEAYTGTFANGPFCDITDRSDVSHLNALQMHHSSSAIYFADISDAEYVEALFQTHAPRIVKPQATFRVRTDVLVDGKPSDGEVMHAFEPQLNHNLSLSFVDCTPVMPEGVSFRHRSPEIVEEHKRLHPSSYEDDA